MSTAAIERHALRTVAFAPALVLAGLMAFLFARLRPDIGGKPLHEDEAVAGLISARPLGDLLHTVVLDRGGAPLHFLLAHVALAIDTTPESLRWLSLVFALATVPVCYDLTRRLAGRSAGLIAAALATTSQLLLVYGMFGRMYSLFAFASALAADPFVRALERPQRRAVLAAAAAACCRLPFIPSALFCSARRQRSRSALARPDTPRSSAGPRTVAARPSAPARRPSALRQIRPGGRPGPRQRHLRRRRHVARARRCGRWTRHLLAVFVRWPPPESSRLHAAARGRGFRALTIAVPPVVLAVASAAGIASDRLAPRHLIFMLPLWIALVAIGATQPEHCCRRKWPRCPRRDRRRRGTRPERDLRARTIPTGAETAVAAPAAWLQRSSVPATCCIPTRRSSSPRFRSRGKRARTRASRWHSPAPSNEQARHRRSSSRSRCASPLDGKPSRRAGVRFRRFPRG